MAQQRVEVCIEEDKNEKESVPDLVPSLGASGEEEQAKIVSDQVDVEEDGGSIIAVSEEANLTSGNNQVAHVEEAWLSPTKKEQKSSEITTSFISSDGFCF